MTIWSAEIKELESLYTSLKGRFPELEKELEQLIRTEDANVVMLYSRRCLEVIITDLCESELKRSRKTEPLKGIIDKLNREEKVPSHIITSMHSLNSLSTYGAHPKEFDPRQVKPVLNNLAIIIDWYGKHMNIEFIKPKEEKAEAPDKMIIDEDYRRTDSYLIPKKSIIVLPFENISPDPDQEYFSDGLTEEIITDLSYIDDLLVISRNSAMTFKGTKKKTKEIASEVNVKYVLEGSVRKAGNNLRIVAQLIDAETDAHLWAEKYSGTLDDVFDIQEKVSRSIAEALKLKLSPEEEKKIVQNPIENVFAYECYLKARNEIYRSTKESLNKSIELIENALEIVGENEILYASLGKVYLWFYNLGFIRTNDMLLKSEQYLEKVFVLNPYSSYGCLLQGFIHWQRGQIQDAVRNLKKAVEIKPFDSETLLILSWMYILSGKISSARPLLNEILKIDPITPFNYHGIGTFEFFDGNFEKALKEHSKALHIDPKNPLFGLTQGIILVYNNRFTEGFELLETTANNYPDFVYAKVGLMLKYALENKKSEAMEILTEEFENQLKADETFPIWIAGCLSLLEENKQAMKWLEYGITAGFINFPYLDKYDPFLEKLRKDYHFKKLMKRVKHEWENFKV